MHNCIATQIKSMGQRHEPVIIRGMVDACRQKPSLWPRTIKFEHKHIKREEKAMVQLLHDNGYVTASRTDGDHRDYVMIRGPFSETQRSDYDGH